MVLVHRVYFFCPFGIQAGIFDTINVGSPFNNPNEIKGLIRHTSYTQNLKNVSFNHQIAHLASPPILIM